MKNKIIIKFFKTPVGEMILGSFGSRLCLADWRYRKMRDTVDRRITAGFDAEYTEGGSEVIELAERQLTQYFKKERREFTVPVLFAGTDFQKYVWKNLQKVPYGKTVTYLELSIMSGNEKAVRAVAAANGANALSIIVPCHRVIGSDGKLTGYAGGLQAKKKLLELESSKYLI